MTLAVIVPHASAIAEPITKSSTQENTPYEHVCMNADIKNIVDDIAIKYNPKFFSASQIFYDCETTKDQDIIVVSIGSTLIVESLRLTDKGEYETITETTVGGGLEIYINRKTLEVIKPLGMQ